MKFSLVLPICNEEGALPGLFAEISAAMATLSEPYEVICVNDGSTDASRNHIDRQCRKDPRFRLLDFSRNFGQSAAMWAGAQHAAGEFIIFLDADGQNNPADIATMLPHLQNHDAVTGCRLKRQDNLVKKLASRFANAIRNQLTGETVSDTGCTLKIIRKSIFLRLPAFDGMHRFLPTLLKMEGATVVEVPVSHRPRCSGQTKYGVARRAWQGFFDLLAVRWLKKRYFPAQFLNQIHRKK